MFERILTTEQLAALGKIVAECARLESMIDGMLTHLTKLTPTQYAAFNHGVTMLGRKIEILQVVGTENLRTGRKRAELKRILESLVSLNADRVVYVHGEWNPAAPAGKGPITISEFFGIGVEPSGNGFAVLKKGSKPRIATAARLETTAAKLRSTYDELLTFWRDNWLIPPLRRKMAQKPSAKVPTQAET